MKLILANDTRALNDRYRGGLAEVLKQRGHTVRSIGVFEGRPLSFSAVLTLFVAFGTPVVSSNFRTNLVVLTFLHLRGLVILNGMGRLRGNRALRGLLVLLVRLNWRKRIAAQNYADYRYLRRTTRSRLVSWVPGSGGTARRAGTADRMLVVQRQDKIAVVAPSLLRLVEQAEPPHHLILVGCSTVPPILNNGQADSVTCTGWVDQADIFAQGRTFLQPAGYGEGIPHTLVDALASGMEVLIEHRIYLQCGLWKLGAAFEPIGGRWGRMSYKREAMRARIGSETINRSYADLFAEALA